MEADDRIEVIKGEHRGRTGRYRWYEEDPPPNANGKRFVVVFDNDDNKITYLASDEFILQQQNTQAKMFALSVLIVGAATWLRHRWNR